MQMVRDTARDSITSALRMHAQRSKIQYQRAHTIPLSRRSRTQQRQPAEILPSLKLVYCLKSAPVIIGR